MMNPSRMMMMNSRRRFLVASVTVAAPALLACACTLSSEKPAPTPAAVAVAPKANVPFPFPPTQAEEKVDPNDLHGLDRQLENRLQATPNDETRLFVRYRQAQLWADKDPKRSCERWLEAAKEQRFPLWQVAYLHAMETCPKDQLTTQSIDSTLATYNSPWLKESFLRAALKRAEEAQDKAAEMRLLVDVARYDRLQSDKVKKLERAIKLASELKDTAFAESTSTTLKAVAPRFFTDAPPSKYISVASDFRQTRAFAKAREWYQKALASPELDDYSKLQALDGIRNSYKLEKDTPNYLRATQEFADYARVNLLLKAKGKLNSTKRALLARYLETQITLARAVWTEGSVKQAQEILNKAETEIRGRVTTASVSLLKARIQEEAGKFNEAVETLNSVNEKRIFDTALHTKILWYKAWNMRKVARFQEAVDVLEKLIPMETSSTLLARNHFWLARTFAQMNQTDKATKEFEWLVENDPLGYYGLLSYRELKRPLAMLGQREEASAEPPPLLSSALQKTLAFGVTTRQPAGTTDSLVPEEKLTFEWLMATNESDLGRRFLDQINSRRKNSMSEEQRFDLLQLYARTGQFQTLFARVTELSASARRKLIESKPELYFPRPWRPIVSESAKKFEVPEELIYSLMRQESSFDPGARSIADAFGLMQLIPEVAQVAGKRAEFMIDHHEDLYRPEVNIPLGAAFLRDLMDRWKETFIPVVASYNASEKAIGGWLKTRFRGDALEFIEDVPYDETKTYLKLVMRNFVFYSRLNSRPVEKVESLAFPEWCLADLQQIKP